MIARYLLPLLALAAFGFAVTQVVQAQQTKAPQAPPVEPAKSPFTKPLAGAGLVEPETENIAMGTHLPGVVDELFVRVGESVKPGQPLFRLDDRQLKAELDVRLAALGNAEAQLEKLNAGPRLEELPPLRAKVAEADASLMDEAKAYERLRRLTTAASDDELSRREMAVEIARARLAKAKADLALTEAGAWKYDRMLAAAAVGQSKAQVEQTRTELKRLVVCAPKPATGSAEFKVLQVNVRPGEYVGSQAGAALVVLGHVGKLHVRVDIDENDIPRFKPNLGGVAKPRGGAGVEIPIAFVRVEPYVIPKRSLTGSSLERVDTRVLQVIYALDATAGTLYVGQQMDVFLNGGE